MNANKNIQEFNFLRHDFCLGDKLLIEASAGTGKTFNIENIVLKLIVQGFKKSDDFQENLMADLVISEVLIVTFTELATAELCSRIRENIQGALNFVENIELNKELALSSSLELEMRPLEQYILQFIEFGYSVENNLQFSSEKRKILIQKLNHALYTFDEASICTIHSFCQKMLKEFSVDSNQLFNNELIDSAELIEKIVYKFIRQHFYSSDSTILNVIALMNNLNYEYFSQLAETLDRYGNIGLENQQSCKKLQKLLIEKQCKIESQIDFLILKREILESNFFENANFVITDFKKSYCDNFNDNLRKFITALKEKDVIRILKQSTFFAYENIVTSLKKAKIKTWQPKNSVVELFQFCQKINEQIIDFVDFVREYFAIYFKEQYEVSINEKPIVTYNELLVKLHRALINNPRLAVNIREKYKVALIDEFQDTDQLQYQIFDKIFGTNESALIMVGDPKQAIYSFRGADIFTYLGVAESLCEEQKVTLIKNYRTSQNLLNAINCLFAKELPFAIDNINYIDAMAGKESDEIFIEGEDLLVKPLKIIQPKECHEFDFTTLNYQQFSVKYTAKKIAEILHLANCRVSSSDSPLANINGKKVLPSDIAVLVRSGAEGDLIHHELTKYKINSVKQSNENIFATQDAIDFLKLLDAILNPQNSRLVMTALALPYFNFDFSDIYRLNYDEKYAVQYEAIVEIFIFYQKIWQRFSFIKMIKTLIDFDVENILGKTFEQFLVSEDSLLHKLHNNNLKVNLLQGENGNRKLTNFNHLVEILHQEEKKNNLQPIGLLNHLQKWLDNPEANPEYELRLESDSQAVQILTIHKSKGLQFPIVFCPFVWRSAFSNTTLGKMKSIVYHDRNNQQKLSLTSEQLADAKEYYRLESLADELRLFYVALTRAKYGCYLIWADKSMAKGRNLQCNAPMDYLFHNIARHKINDYLKTPTFNNLAKCLVNNNVINGVENDREMRHVEPNQYRLWSTHKNIAIVKIDDEFFKEKQFYLAQDGVDEQKFEFKEFGGQIAKDFRVLSFSNLNSNMPHLSEIAINEENDDDIEIFNTEEKTDYNGLNLNRLVVDEQILEEQNIVNTPSILGDFPRGVFSGDCIHDFFEYLDFDYFKEQSIDELGLENDYKIQQFSESLLKKYGRLKFNPVAQQQSYQHELKTRQEQLSKMFKNTVASELKMHNNSFNFNNNFESEVIVLEQLNPLASVCEMPFFFKVDKRFLANQLLELSHQAFNVNCSKKLLEPHDTSELNSRRERLHGFMNGKIDLFFEHHNKFYIADWKSSYLGDFNHNYSINNIEKDMFNKNYYLQAAIYTIAVKKYLENKLKNFDYERDFGGVFYIYVRGIDNEINSGVWSMKPSLKDINELAKLLNEV